MPYKYQKIHNLLNKFKLLLKKWVKNEILFTLYYKK
jgi:hypothetical protein